MNFQISSIDGFAWSGALFTTANILNGLVQQSISVIEEDNGYMLGKIFSRRMKYYVGLGSLAGAFIGFGSYFFQSDSEKQQSNLLQRLKGGFLTGGLQSILAGIISAPSYIRGESTFALKALAAGVGLVSGLIFEGAMQPD